MALLHLFLLLVICVEVSMQISCYCNKDSLNDNCEGGSCESASCFSYGREFKPENFFGFRENGTNFAQFLYSALCSGGSVEQGSIIVSQQTVIQYTRTCLTDYCNRAYAYENCFWPKAIPVEKLICECTHAGMVQAGADPNLCTQGRCRLHDVLLAANKRNGACFYMRQEGKEELKACKPIDAETPVDFSLDAANDSKESVELTCSYESCNNAAKASWGSCPMGKVPKILESTSEKPKLESLSEKPKLESTSEKPKLQEDVEKNLAVSQKSTASELFAAVLGLIVLVL